MTARKTRSDRRICADRSIPIFAKGGVHMRALSVAIGSFALLLTIGLAFGENPASAQGKAQPKVKGLEKALQMVPAQAQEKLLQAAQKGHRKGQTQQQGKDKGKGKGKG
jgi:hypothetical protein